MRNGCGEWEEGHEYDGSTSWKCSEEWLDETEEWLCVVHEWLDVASYAAAAVSLRTTLQLFPPPLYRRRRSCRVVAVFNQLLNIYLLPNKRKYMGLCMEIMHKLNLFRNSMPRPGKDVSFGAATVGIILAEYF
jgi:hypothetical protein